MITAIYLEGTVAQLHTGHIRIRLPMPSHRRRLVIVWTNDGHHGHQSFGTQVAAVSASKQFKGAVVAVRGNRGVTADSLRPLF